MGEYTILAGDCKIIRFKQKFESSEFDLFGLNCIYIYIYIYMYIFPVYILYLYLFAAYWNN